MSISVVIPVKNGAQTLDKCLSSIRSQTIKEIEIIILDSASVDESKSIALKYGALLFDIPAENFNHGLTRNFGVENAHGNFIFLTVQDAWIANNDMLEKMVKHFEDSEVESVTGMQAVPHEKNKNPALWFRRKSTPIAEKWHFLAGNFEQLEPYKQKEICCWDNVNAMYRKTALVAQPFIKANLSEDMVWSKGALEKGWKIIRDPSLVVYHYHHHSFGYSFKVNFLEFYSAKKEFGILPYYPATIIPFLKRAKTIFENRNISWTKKPKWILHNAVMISAHLLSVITFRFAYFLGNQKLIDKALKFFCPSIPQGNQHR